MLVNQSIRHRCEGHNGTGERTSDPEPVDAPLSERVEPAMDESIKGPVEIEEHHHSLGSASAALISA